MATRTFASFTSRLSPSAPGCPHPMLVQYIRDAAIRVCERTLAWRYENPTFNLTAGQYKYSFNRPIDTDVQAIFSATVNNTPLEVLELTAATSLYPDWPVTTTDSTAIAEQGSQPQTISQVNMDQYVVLPAPDADRTYTIRMFYALKPSRDSLTMDEAVFNALERPIMHYALQQLHALPQVSWADRELAVYHARQFLASVTEYRAQANLGVGRSVLVARAPRFA